MVDQRTVRVAGRPRRGHRGALAILASVLFLASVSCSGREESGGGDELDELLLGRVGNYEFTVGDLKKKLAYQYASRLDARGPDGVKQQRELVESSLDELCWVELGERKGHDKSPVVQDTWELSRRFILARETVQREVLDLPEPAPEEIERYYAENISAYQIPTRVQIAHVQTKTEAEARRARDRLRSGEKIEDVAREVSIDERSKNDGGYLAWMTATSGAAHLGMVRAINEAAMRLHPGEVGEPVPLPDDKGWSVIYALDRTEVGPRPLDDALRKVIAEKVITRKQSERRQQLLADLRTEYGYEIYPDAYERYAMTLLTGEELFAMAQREKLSEKKIEQYERIIKHHPQSPYAPQALFMAAFVRANELADYQAAREGFEAFLHEHPRHDLAESARWMLENMEGPDQDAGRLNEVRRRAQSPQ